MVGLAVAVAVLGIEDLGGAGDEQPVPPGEQAGREAEAVEEGGGLVVAAVAIGVLERADDAARLALAVAAEGIVAHLDDPEPAVGAPVEGDRVGHQRLAGDELDREAGRTRIDRSDSSGVLAGGRSFAGGAAAQGRDRAMASRARRLRAGRIGGSSSAGFSRSTTSQGALFPPCPQEASGDTIRALSCRPILCSASPSLQRFAASTLTATWKSPASLRIICLLKGFLSANTSEPMDFGARYPGSTESARVPKSYGANISCRVSSTRVPVLASSIPNFLINRTRSTVRIWSSTTWPALPLKRHGTRVG